MARKSLLGGFTTTQKILLGVLLLIVVGFIYDNPSTVGFSVEKPDFSIHWCIDSDSGINYEERGTTKLSLGGREYVDKCADGETLVEYSCDGTALSTDTINCFGAGYSRCESGRCTGWSENPREVTGVCYDSDDGLTYTTRGRVLINNKKYEDYCITADLLQEYGCTVDKGDAIYNIASCGEAGYRGCRGGACVTTEEQYW